MAATSQKPFEIAIVGGGIAGLTLAIGLQRKNIPITLYEAAPAFGEIGAGVSFGPNAVKAMELIDPSIKIGFNRRATQNQWESKKRSWFDFRVGDERWKQKPENNVSVLGESHWYHILECDGGQNGVHRAHFLDEMVQLLTGDVARFGKRLTTYENLEDGNVKLLFEDGTTATHNAMIACDGIKSKAREQLLGTNHPSAHAVYSGKYAYRGLIPMNKAVELLGEELAKNSQMYHGYHGHVLTFPIEKGNTMNVVAFGSSDDWTDQRWVKEVEKQDMYNDFSGWGKQVRDILSLMQRTDVWALFHHPPAPTYTQQSVCLTGDAAHASTPHQGAGAGMAIEDSYCLSELLAMVNSPQGVRKAFAVFDEVRRPRTTKLVTTSAEGGRLYDMEQEGVKDDIPKAKEVLEQRMKWIWEEDLEKEIEGAREKLREALGAKL